jgi:predicted nucleotidyltransferase component of viral defense system
MAEPVTLDLRGFAPQAADKVIRLLGVLDAVQADPALGPRVCLHGGTALNLFVLGVPRLSVDIDLNYIGATDLKQARAERPALESAVVAVGQNLGFDVTAGKPEHSGRSFRLRYQGPFGSDSVKIDLDYLNRSPLLPVQTRAARLETGAVVAFPLNADIELAAGKTKALVERVAARDLYDVNRLSRHMPELLADVDPRLARRVIVYYLSVSAPFPRPFTVRDRFARRSADLAAQLYPMLRPDDRPTLEDMVAVAEAHIADLSHAADDAESEYLDRAARADFAPDLLFHDYPKTLAAALSDPAARWKTQNLAKTLGAGRPGAKEQR